MGRLRRLVLVCLLLIASVLCFYSSAQPIVTLKANQSFVDQVKHPGRIYQIQNDYDLQKSVVKIPDDCTLVFNGGSINNGVLDLNKCRIVGSGIKCQIKNPGNYSYSLSYYLADTQNPVLNKSVVQTLIDAGIPVIIDYPELTLNNYLSVGSNCIVKSASDKRVILSFPHSKGFVWDKKVYSQNNLFQGLSIISKDNCFDFVNGGASNRPMSVYFSSFNNIKTMSKEGNCFFSGVDNFGCNGDNCTFDNLFEEIEVDAPKGSGFVGLSSITHHFTKIRCIQCGISFFYNCSGVFDSCNGTWGDSPTFYKGTRRSKDKAARYTCVFRNCNVESYKSVLFNCKDALCYMELSLEDCSFYITPNKKKEIDYFPFDFECLLSMQIRNNKFYNYNDGRYDSKHSLFRVGYPSALTRFDTDQDIQITDNNSYSFIVYGNGLLVDSSMPQSSFKKTTYKTEHNLDVGLLRVRQILPQATQLLLDNTKGKKSLPLCINDSISPLFDIVCSLDDNNQVVSLQYVSIDPWLDGYYSRVPWTFYLHNSNKRATIKILDNLNYNGRFKCDSSEDIVLKPGETVKATYFTKTMTGGNDLFYIEPVLRYEDITTPKSGKVRPVHPKNGMEFFDTKLGKPLWWNGGSWVDAGGKIQN